MFKLWLSIWFKQFTQKWKSWSSFTNLFGFPLMRNTKEDYFHVMNVNGVQCCFGVHWFILYEKNKKKTMKLLIVTNVMEGQIQHIALQNTVFHTVHTACTPDNFTKFKRLCREILRENLHSVIVCMWFGTHPLCLRHSESSFTIHPIYLQFHMPLYLW